MVQALIRAVPPRGRAGRGHGRRRRARRDRRFGCRRGRPAAARAQPVHGRVAARPAAAGRAVREPCGFGRRRRAPTCTPSTASPTAARIAATSTPLLLTGYFGGYGEYADVRRRRSSRARALAELAAAAGRPLVVHTMYASSLPADALRRGRRAGVPSDRARGRRAVAAGARRDARPTRRAIGTTSRRSPTRTSRCSTTATTRHGHCWPPPECRSSPSGPSTRAATAQAAAAEIGYPVALKALGARAQIGRRRRRARARRRRSAGGRPTRTSRPALHPSAFSVEAMAPLDRGVELLIGARWDARFGPVALVGLGGVYAEVLRDVAVALAPVSARPGRGDASQAARVPAPRRSARPPCARRRRRRGRAVRAVDAWRPRIPRSASSRSIRCSCSPTAPSALDARIVLRHPAD